MEEGQEGNNQAQSSLTFPLSYSLLLPCTFFSHSPSFPLRVSSVSSLPGYTGPQGDLLLAPVPQHRAPLLLLSQLPSTPPSPPLMLLPLLPTPAAAAFPRQLSPGGEDGEAIQSRAVHQ